MGFFQGDPLPSVTTTTDKKLSAPDYYTDYLTGLSKVGQGALSKTAAEGVAGYDPLQTAGYGQYQTAAGAYQPGLEAAGQTAAKVAGGIDTSRISQLMDPYQQNVVNEMARLSQQNLQRNLLPTMKAGFVGSGGLGSQRYAGALGQALADVQSNLTGQQYGALSSGYQNALKASLDEANLQNQAAQTQAKIAEQEQTLGLAGAKALTGAGAERQKYEQSLLDYPTSNAVNISQLLRNYQVPISSSEKAVAPGQQGQFGPSGFQNIGGILSAIGAAGGASKDNAYGAGISKVTDWLGNLFKTTPSSSGQGTTFTFTNPDPQKQYDESGNEIGTTYYFGDS
jgi:hypothetical protein